MYIVYGLYLMFIVGVIYFDELYYLYRAYGVKNYLLYHFFKLMAAAHKFFKL